MKKTFLVLAVLSAIPSVAVADPDPSSPHYPAQPRTCSYWNGYAWVYVPCFALHK